MCESWSPQVGDVVLFKGREVIVSERLPGLGWLLVRPLIGGLTEVVNISAVQRKDDAALMTETDVWPPAEDDETCLY